MLPSERDYRDANVAYLLREYAEAREETIWLLRMLSDEEWKQAGRHPYRGLTSILDLVQSAHQHDLEHLYQAHRLRRIILDQQQGSI